MRIFGVILGLLIALPVRAATTATDCSYNAVRAALAIAPVNTTVIVPAGTATWSQQMPITRGVTLQGAGIGATVITLAVPNTGGNFNGGAILVNHSDPCEISGFTFQGDGSRNAFAISWSPGGGKVTNCKFDGFQIALYDNNSFGGAFQCQFVNNQVSGRVYGDSIGCINWDTYYPIAFNSTNYFFFEDCSFTINTSFGSGSHTFVSSGQGSSYVVRHCTFAWSADQLSPAFDWHGDQATDGTRGNLSSQIYGNTFAISGSGSLNNLVDARGGQSLVYSNVITGGTFGGANQIRYREEYPSGTSACGGTYFDVVTNAWDCVNSWNGNALTGYCEANCSLMSYHLMTCFSPYTAPPYPHSLNTGGGLPPPPPDPGQFTFLATPYTVSQSGGQAIVTVNRSGGSGAVTVTVATSDGTAHAPHDYVAKSIVLSWADVTTGARTFGVVVNNTGDTSLTPIAFNVTMSAATGGATIAGTNPTTMTINMPPPPTTFDFAIASVNPASGVAISVTTDVNGAGMGATTMTRTYNQGRSVTLTAPATVGANTFTRWLKDGVLLSASASVTVTADANHTFTAVYGTPPPPTFFPLTITSTPNGAAITVTPVDANGAGNGTTAFSRTYASNTTVNVTAPASGFIRWQLDGVNYTTSAATNLLMLAAHTLNAVYTSTNGGTLAFPAPGNVSVSSAAGSVTLQVQASGSSNIGRTVHWTTQSASATPGVDYTTASGTLTWPVNNNGTQPITVTILPTGAIGGPPRVFRVLLDTATGGAAIGLAVAAVSITPLQITGVQATLSPSGSLKIQGSVTVGR